MDDKKEVEKTQQNEQSDTQNSNENANQIPNQKPIKRPIILQDTIKIIRGNHTFELRVPDIITKESPSFFCKKCKHKWLPNNRTFDKIPRKCPKCGDNYWFVSKTELKEIRKERSSMTHSINKPKPKLKVSGTGLMEKKITKREDKKDFKW